MSRDHDLSLSRLRQRLGADFDPWHAVVPYLCAAPQGADTPGAREREAMSAADEQRETFPVRSCPYCGRLCRGETCRAHADLPPLDRAPRETFDADALALERWADELLRREAA